MSSTIEIVREPFRWRDRFRAYRIVVDGSEVGRVKNGATTLVAVAPGRHVLELRIDTTGGEPIPFEIGPDEALRFVCRPGNSAGALATFSADKPWIEIDGPHRS